MVQTVGWLKASTRTKIIQLQNDIEIDPVGIRIEPSQYVPQWYADYSELKATETLLVQEKLLLPPRTLNYLEELKLKLT